MKTEEILSLLQNDSGLQIKSIAKLLSASKEEIASALDKLKEEGIFCGFHAVLNDDLLNDGSVSAMIEVCVSPTVDGGFDSVARKLITFDNVRSLYLMSGGYDLLLLVSGPSLIDVARFVSERLATAAGVLSTRTHFKLKTYKSNGVCLAGKQSSNRLSVSL